MAFNEVSAERKRDPEAIRAAALLAAQALCDREALDYEVATFLSSDPVLEGLVFRNLPIILVDEDSLPADFLQAREAVFHHTVAALELLERELPQIPFRAGDVEPHLEVLKRYGNPGTLYDVTNPALAPTWHELTRRKKLLLHVCCGPDAAGVIEQLKRDFDVVGFWYDPNIQPQEEHDKRLEAFRHIILPQALMRVLGPIGNQLIVLIKDTSLVSAIGITELTLTGKMVIERSAASFEVFIAIALFYLAMTTVVGAAFRFAEHRYAGRS
jgi:hypothetical protein